MSQRTLPCWAAVLEGTYRTLRERLEPEFERVWRTGDPVRDDDAPYGCPT